MNSNFEEVIVNLLRINKFVLLRVIILLLREFKLNYQKEKPAIWLLWKT